jgi:tRNA G10  N-methylase Trm11
VTVLAAHSWRTNAELIADVAKLGYLRREWLTLDPTWGRGKWWTIWAPDGGKLVRHDLHTLDGVSFTDLPHEANTFDAVAFDPPYVSIGGRKTAGVKYGAGMHAAFGLTDAPRTPIGLQLLIEEGMAECDRVLKPRGYLLVKCQDYVSSGKYWPGTFFTTQYATHYGLGLELVDRFEHVATHPRPQPAGRRQVHARRNLSTLLVFRKGKA